MCSSRGYPNPRMELASSQPTDGTCNSPALAGTFFKKNLKKQRLTLPTKVHLVKAMVFPVVMYGCESWTIKKTEHQRELDRKEN